MSRSPQIAKPLAGLSLDLDNQWVYMKTRGDPRWETYPSYFPALIPDVLDLLDEFRLKITFFIVGQDAALDKNRESLQHITERGHEVGNHSFSHDAWGRPDSADDMRRDVLETEAHIQRVTGQKTIGFRGPGFTWSKELIETLAANGYLYDASTLPMFLGPLARMYYFRTSSLTAEQKEERKALYGSFRDGFRPLKPYLWRLSSDTRLLEIPTTTIPVFRIPFHLSYLIYVSRYSVPLMRLYLKTAIALCRISGIGPSFLLHSLDFIGGDRVPELAFFPGMDLNQEHKLKIFRKVLAVFMEHFTFSPMSVFAQSLLQREKLRQISL